MTAWNWPADLRPTEQVFYVETLTARFAAAMSAQVHVAERPGARWRAELTLRALPEQVRRLDALLALGGIVLLPVFGKQTGHGAGPDFSTFAADIGQTGFDDGTLFDDGLGFTEGADTVAVLGGCLARLALGGCRPGSRALTVGDLLQTGPGRVHLITAVGPADLNGVVFCTLAPPLRAPPALGPPVTANGRIAMTLVGGDAADGATEPPARTTYRLAFEEDVSWPIV
ncbi:putative Extracellular solute-binding protein family 3 [uncultured Gammaproteobacteria bacterium]